MRERGNALGRGGEAVYSGMGDGRSSVRPSLHASGAAGRVGTEEELRTRGRGSYRSEAGGRRSNCGGEEGVGTGHRGEVMGTGRGEGAAVVTSVRQR